MTDILHHNSLLTRGKYIFLLILNKPNVVEKCSDYELLLLIL